MLLGISTAKCVLRLERLITGGINGETSDKERGEEEGGGEIYQTRRLGERKEGVCHLLKSSPLSLQLHLSDF